MSLNEEDLEAHAQETDAIEDFRETVAGGRLYEHLSAGRKPVPVDVGQLMIDGVQPPEMTLDGWLVKGELHWVFSDPEAGKTFLALKLSTDVMAQGGTVVYFDEELGESVIAERLVALGADPGLVRERFVYAPFPAWQADEHDIAAHRDFLEALRPTLVVYDTATDMLSEAGFDENSGVDVTQWVKAYPEQARRAGATQLVLDHVGHSEKGRAVGSRAKRAKAKVQFSLKRKARFTGERAGQVAVELEKNTRGANIPEKRLFAVGGSPFAWELLPAGAPSQSDKDQMGADAEAHALQKRVHEALPVGEASAMNVGQVRQAVTGNNTAIGEALKVLNGWPGVHHRPKGTSTLYWKDAK